MGPTPTPVSAPPQPGVQIAGKRELEQGRIAQTKSEKALRRLLDLVEQEIMSPRDPVLAERLAEHRKEIATSKERISMLTHQLSKPNGVLTPEKITRFADLIHAKLHADNSPLRRAYVRMFIDKVIVRAAPPAGIWPKRSCRYPCMAQTKQ